MYFTVVCFLGVYWQWYSYKENNGIRMPKHLFSIENYVMMNVLMMLKEISDVLLVPIETYF
jgi:hypothetical protein